MCVGIHGGSRKRSGFILVELLWVMVLVGMILSAIAISYDRWIEERELEAATMQLTSALRDAAITARYGLWEENKNTTDRVHFTCKNEDDGRIHYWTERNMKRMRIKGRLPKGVRLQAGSGHFVFGKKGFAKQDTEYGVVLESRRKRFVRYVTIAMYTGRIRVTREIDVP